MTSCAKIYLLFFLYLFITIPLKSDISDEQKDSFIDPYLKSNSQTTNSDSVLLLLNEDLSYALNAKDNDSLYHIYFRYANYFSSQRNFQAALEYAFKAQNILDNEMRSKNRAENYAFNNFIDLYSLIGSCFFNIENTNNALLYYKKCLEIIEMLDSLSIIKNDSSFLDNKLVTYNNIGSSYLKKEDWVNAGINFEQALAISNELRNPKYSAAIYNNLGIVNQQQNKEDKAIEFYNESILLWLKIENTAGLIQSYNNIAKLYYSQNKYNKAIEYAEKAYRYSKQIGEPKSEMLAAKTLFMSYNKNRRIDEAMNMWHIYQELNDSIINVSRINYAAQLESEYQYEKLRKDEAFKYELELMKKERKNLFFTIMLIVLVFIILIFILLLRTQKIKSRQSKLNEEKLILKNENLRLETENLNLYNTQLKQNIEFKNKELTTHAMYLLQKNEFNDAIIKRLIEYKETAKSKNASIDSIIAEMKTNSNNLIWRDFEVRFLEVHQDFYAKLNTICPNLTPNESKLCAFLQLGMSSKEISQITSQTTKSLEIARSRLRKKLNLNREDNLTAFLQQL